MGVRWVLAVLAAAFAITGTARAETVLPYAGSGGGEAITHPHVLSAADVRRYREIFRDEQIGRFETSRKLQAELGDDCLIGYVKAEHLLSPHSGHSTPAELNSWLRRYGALSIADRGYVIQTGQVVLADTAENLLQNPLMREAYLGEL